MDSGVPSGRYWEPQPETLEEQEKAYEAYLEKLKAHGEEMKFRNSLLYRAALLSWH